MASESLTTWQSLRLRFWAAVGYLHSIGVLR